MFRRAYETMLAQKLAKSGEEMNLEIAKVQQERIEKLGKENYFLIAVAEAFTWTGYSTGEDEFFENAVEYLLTGDTRALGRAKEFFGWFGAEKLSMGLHGWKTILNNAKFDKDPLTCSAEELFYSQKQLLPIVHYLRDTGKIYGIGAWLFCAPFKIIAAHRKDLWQQEQLDDIWMPLGLEVKRGVRKLIQENRSFTEGISEEMLEEEEGGFEEEMATTTLVQHISKKIAALAQSRVLHINSGLYLYGKGEI